MSLRRMFARAAAVVLVNILVFVGPSAAHASHGCSLADRADCSSGAASDGTIEIEVSTSVDNSEASDEEGGRGGNKNPTLQREVKFVPTCNGSTGVGDVGLCTAALNTCPTDGEVRFWVYSRTVDGSIPGQNPPFEREAVPPFVCRSLEAVPGIDPVQAVAAIVQRDFQSVVVLKGIAEVSPAPDTLVNIPTRFTAAGPASYDIPLMVLGQSVVITATVATWTWHFGDGTVVSTSEAGSRGRVEHVYRQPASRGAYVVITWTGTFRVGGGPVQQVNGTATTTGEPVPVTVKQARTELVGGSG